MDRTNKSTVVSEGVADEPISDDKELREATEPRALSPKNAESAAKRLLKGGAIVTLLRCSGIAAGAVMTGMQGRYMPESDFGNFNLIASYLAFLSFFAMLGLNRSLVRFLPESVTVNDRARAIFTLRAATWLALPSMFVVASAWWLTLCWFPLSESPAGQAFYIASLSATWLLLLTVHQILAESIRGFGNQFFATMLSGTSGGPLANLLFLCLFAGLAIYFPPNLTLVLAANVLAFLVVTPLAIYWMFSITQRSLANMNRSTDVEHVQLEAISIQLIAKTSIVLMLVQTVYFCATQGDLWIAGGVFNRDDLAIYSAARKIVPLLTLPLQLGSVAVVPMISSLYTQNRRQELSTLLKRVGVLCFLPSLLPLLIILIMPGKCLEIFVGPKYVGGAWILVILSIGQMSISWGGAYGMVLMMTGKQNAMLVLTSIMCAFLMIASLIGASLYGLTGLAVAASLTTIIQTIALVFVTHKLTGIWTQARW